MVKIDLILCVKLYLAHFEAFELLGHILGFKIFLRLVLKFFLYNTLIVLLCVT